MKIMQRNYGILGWLFRRDSPESFIVSCEDCGHCERILVCTNAEGNSRGLGSGTRVVTAVPATCPKCGGARIRKQKIQLRL